MGTTADNILFNIPGTLAEDMVVLCGRFDIMQDPDADPAVYSPIIADIECNGFTVVLGLPTTAPFIRVKLGKFPKNKYGSLLGVSCNLNAKGNPALLASPTLLQFHNSLPSITDDLWNYDDGYPQQGIDIQIRTFKDEPVTAGLASQRMGILIKLVLKTTSRFRGTTTYHDDS